MKTPTAKKLPSGSWAVRIMVDGKSTCITRPTKREAEQEAIAIKSKAKAAASAYRETVKDAIDEYIRNRESVLSVSTVRGYKKIRDLRFQKMMQRPIASITQAQWQQAVSAEAKTISAKTLHNAWGFISSVIKETTGEKITVRLPQVISNEASYLSSSDLKRFLAALSGNQYEIGVLLGLSGLRRSEIMDVRWEDIDLEHNCIYVHGSAVQDEHNALVHKSENKNSSSRRTVPFILPQLREAIEHADKTKSVYAVNCYPNTLNLVTQRICSQLGLPKCTCHGLRKSFASMMLVDLKQPEAVVMQAGGWSDPGTMRKIYTQVSTDNLNKAGEAYSEFFKNL